MPKLFGKPGVVVSELNRVSALLPAPLGLSVAEMHELEGFHQVKGTSGVIYAKVYRMEKDGVINFAQVGLDLVGNVVIDCEAVSGDVSEIRNEYGQKGLAAFENIKRFFKSVPASTTCELSLDFGSSIYCEHLRYFAEIYKDSAVFKEELKNIKTARDMALGAQPVVQGSAASSGRVVDRLKGRIRAALLSGHSVMILGRAGIGKTYLANELGKEESRTLLEMTANKETDTAKLFGHYLKSPDGGNIFKDGEVVNAVRLASTGEKVVFVLNELPRIGGRYINSLLGVLDGHNGRYRVDVDRGLPSARFADIASPETLSCAKENLWFIATGNTGADYGISFDELDPALRRRFRTITIDDKDAEQFVSEILEIGLSKNGLPSSLLPSLVSFYRALYDAKNSLDVDVEQCDLMDSCNPAVMIRAMEIAKKIAPNGKIKVSDFLIQLWEEHEQWCGRASSGMVISEHKEFVAKKFQDCFGFDIVSEGIY